MPVSSLLLLRSLCFLAAVVRGANVSWIFFKFNSYFSLSQQNIPEILSWLSYFIFPPSPAIRGPLPVFIKQKNAEILSWPSYFIFPLPSPALREPLPVSLFAAEHAIRRPGNFQPSATTRQNTPLTKSGKIALTKSGIFAEISILSCLPTRFRS